MNALLQKLLARETLSFLGLLWGVGGLAVIGYFAGQFRAAGEVLGPVAMDELYHFHISAVLTAVLAIFLFIYIVAKTGSRTRAIPLRETYKVFLVANLIAVVVAAAVVLGIGWGKEVLDALNGHYADPADFHADIMGVMRVTIFSLAILLPGHALMVLAGGALRHRLIVALTPRSARHVYGEYHRVEQKLTANLRQLSATRTETREIEGALRKLEERLRRVAEDESSTTEREDILAALESRQRDFQETLLHLDALERENESLRRSLQRLVLSLAAVPGSALLAGEMEHLIQRSLEQSRLIDETCQKIKQLSRKARTNINWIKPEPEDGDSAASAAVPAAVLPAAADPGSEKQEERRGATPEPKLEVARRSRESAGAAPSPPARPSSAETDTIDQLKRRAGRLRRLVLVIDDDPVILNICQEILEATRLIRVVTAPSAVAAIELMRKGPQLPDLIILDIQMPEISGTRFYRALQENRKLLHIPVIFCSGFVPDSLDHLSRFNHLDFIEKPFTVKRLRLSVLRGLGLGA